MPATPVQAHKGHVLTLQSSRLNFTLLLCSAPLHSAAVAHVSFSVQMMVQALGGGEGPGLAAWLARMLRSLLRLQASGGGWVGAEVYYTGQLCVYCLRWIGRLASMPPQPAAPAGKPAWRLCCSCGPGPLVALQSLTFLSPCLVCHRTSSPLSFSLWRSRRARRWCCSSTCRCRSA